MPALPSARGPLTDGLLDLLRGTPSGAPADLPGPEPVPDDPLADDDLHLALYLCYELHYRGLDGVDERWEWEPSLLAARRGWEYAFEAALVELLGPVPARGPGPAEMDVALRELVQDHDGPSLSRHLERDGTLDEVLEFVIHRSAYQLKEADPHSWAIARLSGPPKAALVEVQADEYGGG